MTSILSIIEHDMITTAPDRGGSELASQRLPRRGILVAIESYKTSISSYNLTSLSRAFKRVGHACAAAAQVIPRASRCRIGG